MRKMWGDPYWLRDTLVRKFVLPTLFRANDGQYVVNEEWDNLIILDACRYDTFAGSYRTHGLRGRLEHRVSRGTETNSFLKENFGRREYYDDIVYVSANPTVTQRFSRKFFRVIPVWKEEWDSRNHTVLPERMYRRTLQAMSDYPDKRLIIHFLQPHRPFIGYPYPDWWKRKSPGETRINVWGSMNERGRSWLSQADRGTLLDLYARNLDQVLPFVKRLQDALPGNTVTTSDHGEAFGDLLHPLVRLRVYGHPGRTRIPALTKVPWLVAESDRMRRAASTGMKTAQEALSEQDEGLIEERLRALGYD